MFASFAIIYKIARMSTEIARSFPPRDCDAIGHTYGDQLQMHAVIDYDFITKNDGIPSSGALQCFCQQEESDNYEQMMESAYGHP